MIDTLISHESINLEDSHVFELSQANQETIKKELEHLDILVFDEMHKIENLDFEISANRAFVFLLLDLYERLQQHDGFRILLTIASNYGIETGSRIQAAALFLDEDISEAPQYLERYDDICKKITIAIEEEEDNDKKSLATFANYYLRVLSLNPKWIGKLRDKIEASQNEYNFLSNLFVKELLGIPVGDETKCANAINALKDELLDRLLFEKVAIYNTPMETNSPYYSDLISIKPPSFQAIRRISQARDTLVNKLSNRGATPLMTPEEMYKYMVSLGNMHYNKMISAFDTLGDEDLAEELEIIDWGCGQALATMVLAEYYQNKGVVLNPIHITLIEPSELVMKRAVLHTNIFFPNSKIKTVCKFIDDLDTDDIQTNRFRTKIHLFSNILDVEFFSLKNLITKIQETQKGKNYFICVSPYVNDLKTQRLEGFMNSFRSFSSFVSLGKETNPRLGDYWLCNKTYRNNRCYNHDVQKGSCDNKWTRVLRIFKVEL